MIPMRYRYWTIGVRSVYLGSVQVNPLSSLRVLRRKVVY